LSSFHHKPPRVPDRPGTALAPLEAIPDGQGRAFDLVAEDGAVRAIFVVRRGGGVYGYLNVCPHAGLPLDYQPDAFMAPDGASVQCSMHAARFRIEDGACLAGPCEGQGLSAVAVFVDSRGTLRLAGET
jgi:nitrite reductase/ring-hydroxylating ferredoxin subunit